MTSETAADGHYDVAIIGAGLSGLAAGIRCAYFEKKVAVFERHTTVGGLNSFYRLGGRNHDVGLHAVTNYAAPGTRRGPLAKLLKQLRLRWDDFSLRPQRGSRIDFAAAGATLRMSNDPELLRSEVARQFPSQADGFDALRAEVLAFDSTALDQPRRSAREAVAGHLSDALLRDMLFNPLQYYGSAIPGDMDWSQFCIMWQAIFEEGFGRPFAGVRPIMKALTRKYREEGGELRLRSGVRRLVTDGGRASGLVLDDGTEITADLILSSAGSFETEQLTREDAAAAPARGKAVKGEATAAAFDPEAIAAPPEPRLGFLEAIYMLDRSPQNLPTPHEDTIVFFCTAGYGSEDDRFKYQIPADAVDPTSGVICSPNNFAYDAELDGGTELDEGVIRVTSLANPAAWIGAGEGYSARKAEWTGRLADAASGVIGDFREQIVDTDTFTPRTIAKYTGKAGGNIYGAPEKVLSGRTEFENLHLIGTDQGFLGIVGAMLSGISIANGVALR